MRFLQLDEAIALIFSTPFFVAALSGPIWASGCAGGAGRAIAVGFLGVAGGDAAGCGSFHPAALLSLSAAMLYALYSITTRILARTDSSATTLFYSNIVGAVALIPVLPFVWTTPSDPLVIALMVGTGLVGGFGHYLLIAAHRLAPAAVLSPFIYTEIVWVTVVGLSRCSATCRPAWTLTGAAIVVASGLYILHRERKHDQRPASAKSPRVVPAQARP